MEDTKTKLAAAKAAYLAIAETAKPAEARAAHEMVKALQAELIGKITAGALPCSCGAGAPHGIEQPLGSTRGGDRSEFEIGCLACGRSVRGGILARHAVEAWNEKHGKAPDPEATAENEAAS